MGKLKTTLLRIVGRFRMAYEVLLQQGVVALPLAVVLIIFAYDNSEKWFSVPLWFLVVFLVWIGWKSFDIAKKRIELVENKRKAESDERKARDEQIISLLAAIAGNTKTLRGKDEEVANDKPKL